MVVARAVTGNIVQPIYERLVQHCMTRDVAVGTLVQREADFYPLVSNIVKLPARDDGKDLYCVVNIGNSAFRFAKTCP